MNKENLETLVASFRETREDYMFTAIYVEVSKRWTSRIAAEAHHCKVDQQELQAVYDEVVMTAVNDERISPEYFRNYVGVMLKSKRLNLIDKTRRRNRRFRLHKQSDADETDLDYVDAMNFLEGNLGKDSFEEAAETKKETEQRQLLDFLIDPAKVIDHTTTAIVSTVLSDRTPGKFKPKAIGNKLGVHHSKVTRKLSSLKKNYDESLFGDYRDYLHA
jgi:hypothetical protein